MQFLDIFPKLLNSHNVTQKQLAEYLGIRQLTISEWKTKNKIPNVETLIKIAQYFNVSLDYLLTGEEKNLSSDEVELISNYRNLDNHDKSMARTILSAISNNK